MRLLSRRGLRARLLVFGALSAGFMVVVAAVEQIVSTTRAPTLWTLVASILGVAAVLSLFRWRVPAQSEPQEEWQPGLLLRVLAGGLSFQAGLLGYFVAGDLAAAVVGCGLFLGCLSAGWRLVGGLEFAVE